MTGEWESKLKKIEQNDYDPDQFMAEIIQFTQQIKDESDRPLYDHSRLGDCPLCQKPVIEGRKGYGCSDWKAGCQFVLWKEAIWRTGHARTWPASCYKTAGPCKAYAIKPDDDVFNAQLTLNKQGETGYIKAESRPVAASRKRSHCRLPAM